MKVYESETAVTFECQTRRGKQTLEVYRVDGDFGFEATDSDGDAVTTYLTPQEAAELIEFLQARI